MSALANALDTEIKDRAAINAANAQFSTGPKSDAGKDRVKFNAVKTGLFARTIVLPHEDQSAYDALGADLQSRWNPQTSAERELTLAIQNLSWRLDRVVALECNLYTVTTAQQFDATTELFPTLDEPARLALAQAAGYLANLRAFKQLSSQESRLLRSLDRARRELAALACERTPPSEPLASPVAPPAAEPDNQPAPAATTPATGFVPTKFPANMPVFVGKKAKQHRRLWLIRNGHLNLA